MNTPISFPIAKLLKEKGFDDECKYYYDENEELDFHIGYIGDIWRNSEIKDGLPYTKEKSPCISAPTIADVVMWLYEKHGIWILVGHSGDKEVFMMVTNINGDVKWNNKGFESPTEAYESAFEYILNNLI